MKAISVQICGIYAKNPKSHYRISLQLFFSKTYVDLLRLYEK